MRSTDWTPRSPRNTASRRSDRKSTRLNSSHSQISYAVFCLKKKKKHITSCRNPIPLKMHFLRLRHLLSHSISAIMTYEDTATNPRLDYDIIAQRSSPTQNDL